MIPKITHAIWIGEQPFNDRLQKCRKQLLKLHPEWEHRMHKNEDVENILNHPELGNLVPAVKALWDNIENFGRQDTRLAYKADLLRLCVVYCQGGFYVDSDLWFVQSLDDMVDDPLVLAKAQDNPLLVVEAVVAAPAKSYKVLQLLKTFLVKRCDNDGIITPSFSRTIADNKWNSCCKDPIVFIPHNRKTSNQDNINKYKYDGTTKAIHLWSDKSYDYKELSKISERLVG